MDQQEKEVYVADQDDDDLVFRQEDINWLLKKLNDEPDDNPRLAKLLADKSSWER